MNSKFPLEQVELFCRQLIEACGVSKEDSEVIAKVVLDISLDGIDTHGVSRLPQYLVSFRKGRINPRPNIQVSVSGATAVVDGDNALGHVVSVKSMETAINLAKEYGIGMVTAKHSNHFGAASYYCKQAIKENMIGIVFTNAPCGVAPWGGKRPYFGTNPMTFGFPNNQTSIIVDTSTSTVARGNILLAAKQGKEIPLGWALDKEGRPTTDAKEALDGALLTLGGGKGFALAVAVEILAGILSGSGYGTEVGWIYDDSEKPVNMGHCFIAVDVSRFMPTETFFARLLDMVQGIKSIPLAEGFDEIRIPGERREAIAQTRRQEGIPVAENILNELNDLAKELGVNLLRN
ncbi:MAG: Ldh family oxidoreductase [Desulfitobacterium hafniense]|nr:Ldh family oxidoreductase [Desulfitobacterium hafniense]